MIPKRFLAVGYWIKTELKCLVLVKRFQFRFLVRRKPLGSKHYRFLSRYLLAVAGASMKQR
jgi:hypothetical protein